MWAGKESIQLACTWTKADRKKNLNKKTKNVQKISFQDVDCGKRKGMVNKHASLWIIKEI